MARVKRVQTNFTGGQIDAGMFGRADLRAYTNGMWKLRNVFVRPLGGIRRRPGALYVDTLPSQARLVAFEFNTEQVYLVALVDRQVLIYRDSSLVATIDGTPWTESDLRQVAWTQSADTLLIVHRDYPPKKITRTSDTQWTIADWTYSAKDDDQSDRIYQPHASFPVDEIKLNPGATTGNGVSLTADGDVFVDAHVGVRFRIKDKEVEIASVTDAQTATMNIIEALSNTTATLDWTEAAFSPARGWPVSTTFHQDRLAIGGGRDAPNNLWLSKTSEFFNFDLGNSEDDEAIDVQVLSDQVNAIRGVFSGRDLQVFTSGAEYRVVGDPVTPADISIKRQTRLGSRVDRHIPPLDIDGATIFIPRLDPRPREFLYSDIEQAYAAIDLAIVSNDIVNSPVSTAYDQDDRLFHVVNGDGTMASLTVYRNEEVAAWTLQETDGMFRDVETVFGDTFVVIERGDVFYLCRLDDSVNTDMAVLASEEISTAAWGGLDHIEGETVRILADGFVQPSKVVVAGAVTLDEEVAIVEAGLPYTHTVWPLPLNAVQDPQDANVGTRIRRVAVRFRVLETEGVTVDLGSGFVERSFRNFGGGMVLDQPLPVFTGEYIYRQRGWMRSDDQSLWKIEQDTPLPFELLSAITEFSLND